MCRFGNSSATRTNVRFRPIPAISFTANLLLRGVRVLGGRRMRIGLPKPLHGWNAVAWDLAIVTLGVLIALFAQQLVQDLHDRSAAEDARKNIRAELGANLARMQGRDQRAACIGRRLDEIAHFLDEARKGRSLADVTWIGRPPVFDMEDTRWQAATSAGRSSLFSADEQSAIGDVYSLMADWQAQARIEQETWAKLRGLAGLEHLSEARDASLSDALQQARYSRWILNINSKIAQENAKRLGVRVDTVAPLVSLDLHCDKRPFGRGAESDGCNRIW